MIDTEIFFNLYDNILVYLRMFLSSPIRKVKILFIYLFIERFAYNPVHSFTFKMHHFMFTFVCKFSRRDVAVLFDKGNTQCGFKALYFSTLKVIVTLGANGHYQSPTATFIYQHYKISIAIILTAWRIEASRYKSQGVCVKEKIKRTYSE